MDRIFNLSKSCKEFFTSRADDISVITGFIKRKRKMTGSSFIRTLVLGNMTNGHCSIEGMCQLLQEDDVGITKQGLDFRFTKSAVEFMKTMYEECMHLFQDSIGVDCKILAQFRSVKLLDSSQIVLPEVCEDIYKGCNASYSNRANKMRSSVKLQVVFDYLHQALEKLDLTDGKSADQGYREHLEDIKSNDLFIADLGYFVPSSFMRINNASAYFISRYKSDTNVYDPDTGIKLDLLELLRSQSFICKDVLLGKETKLPIRIICCKLTDAQSETRRRKAHHAAKGHGYKSSAKNQQLLNWSIFITNIPEHKVKAEHIWTIYRVRWQIELLFKLYKSHMQIEVLKGRSNASRILCELYAKLCGALIFHGISGCITLKPDREISPTKALIELKKRGREFFLILLKSIDAIQAFLTKLITDWSKFCLKDRRRKTRISSLNMLQKLTVEA
jgi:hypothetical protein